MLKVIDLFCGGGGTTAGFHRARYRGQPAAEVVACVNHDAGAIRSHAANFPECRHYTEDVRTLDVRFLPRKSDEPSNMWCLWASLECTHFSNAKNGPRNADSRTLAHALFPYIDWIKPDYIMIENVREFLGWGELCEKGKPVNRKKGIHYIKWVQRIEAMGYRYQYRLLNSADYGSHQSRLRYFGIFAKGDMPIAFPEPTHDRLGRHGLPKWKPVREVLDLDQMGESIFNRKKPLSPNTLKRILAGLVKFVANGDDTFLVQNYGGRPEERARSIEQPAGTITTRATQQTIASVKRSAWLLKYNSACNGRDLNRGNTVDGPAPTIMTGRTPQLVQPAFLLRSNGGPAESRVNSTDVPAGTITTSPNSMLVQYNGKPTSNTAHSTDKPSVTLSTRDRLGLVRWMDNRTLNGKPSSVDSPAPTLVTDPTQSMCTAVRWMDNQFGNGGPSSIEQPAGTLLAIPKRNLCAAFMLNNQHDNTPASLEGPAPTITTASNHYPVFLLNTNFDNTANSVDEPSKTVTADRHWQYLVKPERDERAPRILRLGHRLPLFGLKSIAVERKIRLFMAYYGIQDIYMRMLSIPELKRIQGLGTDYVLHGNQGQQKKYIGNAVVPHVVEKWAEAICEVNFEGHFVHKLELKYA